MKKKLLNEGNHENYKQENNIREYPLHQHESVGISGNSWGINLYL